MNKKLSPGAIVALKEALCNIYWYKADLRSFIQNCVSNQNLIGSLNWQNYKRQIVSDLIDRLCGDQERYLPDLTKLCNEVSTHNSFSHLEQLEDGKKKAQKAKDAVKELNKFLQPHKEIQKENDAIKERRKKEAEKLKENKAVREKLKILNDFYISLISSSDHQKRGFDLEKLFYDLFNLFDLDPKASFKVIGEQIDGAFSLENTDYLFEAKWQNKLAICSDLDSFSAKIERKLDNTLGLFLSINGFSEDGIQAHSKSRPKIILMDGSDLMAVLEERIDFVSLLLRKKSHAAHTGSIYLPFHKFDS